MAREPLFHNDYSPQFSGHETFPLRYGWLKKGFDRVAETEEMPETELRVGATMLSHDSVSGRTWSHPCAIGLRLRA